MNQTFANLLNLFTFTLCCLIFYTISQHEVFNYDNYDYVGNALSLSKLSPEPFGFNINRPILISIMVAPIAKLFYSTENPLLLMKLAQIIAGSFIFVMMLTFWKLFIKDELRPLTRSFLLWSLIGNVLVIHTSLTSMTDGWAATFAFLSFASYIHWREVDVKKSLWYMCLFWLLAGCTRHNYFSFGAIFLCEEFWRFYKKDGRLVKKHLLLSYSLVAGCFTLLLLTPFAIKYGSNFWSEFKIASGVLKDIFEKVALNDYVYHKILTFSLPLPLLFLAAFGFIFSVRNKKNAFINRLLIFYCLHFLITHNFLILSQFVRFMMPMLLPLIFFCYQGIRVIRSYNQSINRAILVSCVLFSCYPIYQHFTFLKERFFYNDQTVAISKELSSGNRVIWYGRLYPFAPKNENYHVQPVETKYHYGNNVFKVQTAKKSFYLSYAAHNEFDPLKEIPLAWSLYIEDGDRMLYNPNKNMFYNHKNKDLLPLKVLHFSRTPYKDIAQALQENEGQLVVKRTSEKEAYVAKLSGWPLKWLYLTQDSSSRWTAHINQHNQTVNNNNIEVIRIKEIKEFSNSID